MPAICPLCRSEVHFELLTMPRPDIDAIFQKAYRLSVAPWLSAPAYTLRQCAACHLRFFDPLAEGDESFYDRIRQHSTYYAGEKPEFAYALQQIAATGARSILDVGGGAGHFARHLSGGYAVAVAEKSPAAQAELKKQGIALDQDQATYDFVTAMQVLEHVADAAGFLAWICSKAKPGGHVLITVPDADSSFVRETNPAWDWPPHHLTRWSRQTLERLPALLGMEAAGYFHDELSPFHYRMIVIQRRKAMFASLYRHSLTRLPIQVLATLADAMLLPQAAGIPLPGSNHGILLRKPR